jgi:hypothetical protein
MNLDPFSDHFPGWLALVCAIAVFVAVALDAPGEKVPAVANVVQATP